MLNNPAKPPDINGEAMAYSSSDSEGGSAPARTPPRELVRLIGDFCEAATLRKRNAALIGLVRWTRQSGVLGGGPNRPIGPG